MPTGPIDIEDGGAYVHDVAGKYTLVAKLENKGNHVEITSPDGSSLGHIRANGPGGKWYPVEAVKRLDADTYQILGNRSTPEQAISLLLSRSPQ